MADEQAVPQASSTEPAPSPVVQSVQTAAQPEHGSMEHAAQRIRALSQPDTSEQQAETNTNSESENDLNSTTNTATQNDTATSNDNAVTETQEENNLDDNQRLEQDALEDASDQLEIDASQFSQLLSLNDDQLLVSDEGAISFKTKVDGVENEVTLPELIKSYQNEATLTNRSMEVSALIKARDESLQGAKAMAEQQATYTAALLETLNNEYLGDLQQADLDQLRIDDPAEYSAKQLDFTHRQNKIKELASQSLSLLQEQQNNQALEQQRLDSERIPVEQQALKDYFKSNKIEVNQALQNDLTTYLSTLNYTNDEINNTVDHRFMILAYKAKQFDQGMKRATDKTSKKKLPRVIKSGTKPSKQAITQEKALELQSRARKSGSIEDALARVRQLK